MLPRFALSIYGDAPVFRARNFSPVRLGRIVLGVRHGRRVFTALSSVRGCERVFLRQFKMFRTALMVLGLATSVPSAKTSQLTLTVEGVRRQIGEIRAALCTQEEFRQLNCRYSLRAPVHEGPITLRFEKIPRGEYAVAVFHDLHGDGRVHRSFFGLPNEGVGFSRNPFLFGKPAFADTSFDLQSDAAIVVKLRFEPSE